MIVHKNDFFIIESKMDNLLFITVSKPGFDFTDFNSIIIDMPTIQIKNFNQLKDALEKARGEAVEIGTLRPRIEIFISKDEMEASIKLNISAREMVENKIGISTEIISALESYDIREGLVDLFSKPLTVQKKILVARGTMPINGEDAKVSYFHITDKKPKVKVDGSVNHYELNLIDNIKKGDWLGEKIMPTDGIPGKTVSGKLILPIKGKDEKLKYDNKTVGEFNEDGKIVLRALVDGAVKFDKTSIRVDSHLIIPGDVDYGTGNIVFGGSVTIQGIVKDSFSVIANDDIAILGEMGIGAVDKIVSKEGSIYIKGGVYGKATASIEAAKNVYVKYCNECSIFAGEDINIGYYSLDCNLSAKSISLDPVRGKLMGGNANARVQVIAGIIGNKSDKKTKINVQGFDRNQIKKEFEDILLSYKDKLEKAATMKQQIESYENIMSGAEYMDMTAYNEFVDKYDKAIEEIKDLDERRIKLQKILLIDGEGAIEIVKEAYPETYIEIKNLTKKIDSIVKGIFYVNEREMHHK